MATLSAWSQSVPNASAPAAVPAVGLYRIAGTVLNVATGEPVRRATVAVLPVADNRILQSVLSGEDGRFALDGLPAGKYQLAASKRGYHAGFYDQHEEYNSAIVIGEGQQTEHLTFRLFPGVTLRGVVTDDGGDPVENASVMLFRKSRGQISGDRITMVESVSSDDTGAYEFTNLAPGQYLLAFYAEPWYAMHQPGDETGQKRRGDSAFALDLSFPVTYFDSTTDEASASLITLTADSRAEANVVLHAVPSLHLSVPLSGKQREANVQTGLRLSVFGTPALSPPAQIIQVEQNSMVEFSGFAPGRYELEQGNPPHRLELDLTASQKVDPNASAPAAAVSGILRAAQNSGSDAGLVTGGEITLLLMPLDRAGSRPTLETTAQKGAFNFGPVAPGEWMLRAGSSGKEWQVLSIAVDGVTRSGNQLTVQDRSLALAVTVSENATRIEGFARREGKGVGGVMIVLVPNDPAANLALSRRDQSDSDGSFALLDAVPGQYTVVAIADGWDLDWSRPEVIARYLPQGVAVSIANDSGKLLHLAVPVPVQPR